MSQSKRYPRTVRATSEGQNLLQCLRAKAADKDEEGKSLSYDKLAEKIGYINEKTLRELFNGEAVRRNTVHVVCNFFNVEPTDIVDPEDWAPIPSDLTPAQKLRRYPQRLCQKMLGKQIKGLPTNPITVSGGIKFDLEDIYLNLRLEPYKQLDTYPQPISAFERLNLSQLPTSGDTHFFEDDEQFIEQVLKPGCSESFRKRIAILGEPGAGKTTLLKKIAFHLLAQQLPKPFLVIWISLADLQGQELEDYLLKVWLKQVLDVGSATPDMEEALVEFFNQERVWLLLDGLDEMVKDNPLVVLKRQLRGFLAGSRLVLTGRHNVWTTEVNPLDDFDAYRLEKFSSGENQSSDQVAEFIGKWFKSNPQLGEQLIDQLKLVRRRQFRPLVTNPLLLTLLCYSWQRQPKPFPETRAELKKRFLEALFNWNRERIPLTEQLKDLLIKALGNLALEMFDELGASGFRFSKKRLLKFLGEPDDPLSLCCIALELGWIAKLGGDKPFELVYAFFHPTFQAYFAAQVIDDWDFFLPRSHINQPVVDETNSALYKPYRVFEPQWKEVFLLWLGREDVPVQEKIDFLTTLMLFPSRCGTFYKTRALFLTAAGTAEFRELYQNKNKKLLSNESSQKLRDICIPLKSRYDTLDESLSRSLIGKACGCFDGDESTFSRIHRAIEEAAESTLLEMDEQVVCPILVDFYWTNVDRGISPDSHSQLKFASLLGQISPTSPETQKIIEHFLLTSPRNDEIFLRLLYLFQSLVFEFKIDNIELQNKVKNLFQPPGLIWGKNLKTSSEYFQRQGLDYQVLSSTTFINKESLKSLLELSGSCSDFDTLYRANKLLEKLDPADPEVETILTEYCQSDNELSCQAAASILGKIYADSPTAVLTALNTLIELIGKSENPLFFDKVLKSIKQILHSQRPEIIKSVLKNCRYYYFFNPAFRRGTIRYDALYSIIFYCAEKLPYSTFYQVWHS
jgi:DNA-binding Xre family transcriptional regulator/GTPase SAR1 family protein